MHSLFQFYLIFTNWKPDLFSLAHADSGKLLVWYNNDGTEIEDNTHNYFTRVVQEYQCTLQFTCPAVHV